MLISGRMGVKSRLEESFCLAKGTIDAISVKASKDFEQ